MKRNPSWSFFRRFHRRSSTIRPIAAVLTIFSFFLSNIVFAAQIVTDGMTDTQVSAPVDNVTNVTTTTIHGINAFNSFSEFNVYSGDTVNLHVPDSTLNLVNMVHSEATTVNGLLNSIQNGQIGGNVFFLNPHGFVVGQQGVMNVGSLTVATPTVSFMEGFFDSPGNPSPASADMLFTGAVPIRENGLISIQGTVNAINDITLLGGNVNIAGTGLLTTGAYFDWDDVNFSDVVNTGEIEDGAVFSIENGNIYIRALDEVDHSGIMKTDPADYSGPEDVEAGNVEISAGGSISLHEDAVISTRNASNGADLLAAGSLGSSGELTMSAPEIILEAGSKLLSHVEDGSLHRAGDITLEAVNIEETPLIRLAGNESKTATISIDGATIRGGNIDITARAGDSNPEDGAPAIQDNWTFGELETLLDDNVSLPAAVMIKRAEAAIKINEDPANQTVISSSGNVNINAVSTADGTVKAISGGTDPLTNNPVTNIFSVGYSKAEATAKVEVGTGVVIDAAGDVSLQSDASATASATARTSQNLGIGPSSRNNIAVSLAIANSGTTSHATVAEGSSVTAGGTVAVHARGQSTNIASAETGTYDDGLAGVAIGLGFSNADILARVGGTLTSEGVLPVFNPATAVTDGAFDLGVDHGLITGQQVKYDNGGGAGISGLEHGKTYYVIVDSLNPGQVRLAETFEKALANDAITAIDAAVATGSAHRFIQGIDVAAELAAQETASGVAGIRGDPLVKDALLKGEVAPFLPFILTGATKGLRNHVGGWWGGDTDWSLAGSLAYADVDNTVKAEVGGAAVLKARMDVNVAAEITDRVQTVAESVIAQQEPDPGSEDLDKAISTAVIAGSYNNTAKAIISSNARVDAGRRLDVDAGITYPFLTEPGLSLLPFTMEDFESPAKLGTVLDQKLGIQSLLFNSWARSVATGGDLGISGSVDYMSFTNTAEAVIEKNALINQDSHYRTTDQSVSVNAATQMNLIDMSGVFDLNLQVSTLTNMTAWDHPFAEWVDMGATGKTGAGGSVLLMFLDNTTIARIEDGASVSTGPQGGLSVGTRTDVTSIALAQSGSKAKTFGVAGTFSYIDHKDETLAFIDSGAKVSGGKVNISATDDTLLFNVAGGVIKGENMGVGASVSINAIERDTRALIGHAAFDPSACLIGGDIIDLGYEHGYETGDTVVYLSGGGASIDGLENGKAYEVMVVDETRISLMDTETGAVIDLAAAADMGASHMLVREDGSLSSESDVSLTAANTGSLSSYSLAAAVVTSKNDDETQEETSPMPDTIADDDPLDGVSLPRLFNEEEDGGDAQPEKKPKAAISVAGDVSVNLITDRTHAGITGANTVEAEDVDLSALSDSTISSIAGAATMAGSEGTSVGLAGSVTFNELDIETNASIQDSSLDLSGDLGLSAETEGTIRTISASGSLERKDKGYGLAGSVSVNQIDSDTYASISRSDIESAATVDVSAEDDTSIRSIAGSASYGGKAGIGASVAVNITDNDTEASVQDSDIAAGGDIMVSADERSGIKTVAASLGASKDGMAIAGSAAVSDLTNTTKAYIEGKKTGGVTADGNVSLAAADDADILSVAGNIAIAKGSGGIGGAGFGGAASIVVTDNTVESYIGSGSVVTAKGLGDGGIDVYTGEKDHDGNRLTENMKGVSVTATSHEDILSVAAGGTGAEKLAVQGSAAVHTLDEKTEAYIGSGAEVTAGEPGGTGQSVNVLASDETDITGIAGAAMGSLQGGIGAGADVGVISKNTRAYIGNNGVVDAAENITIQASSKEDINSIAGTVAVGKNWAFGGAASVYAITNQTKAYIEGGDISTTDIHADGSIVISASNSSEIDSIAGSGVFGMSAGIGASAATTVIDKTTEAFIGKNATVTADGNRDAVEIATGRFIVQTHDNTGDDYDVDASDTANLNMDTDIDTTKVASAGAKELRGLAVTALSKDDVSSIAASGGGSGTVAINLAGSVNVIGNNTSAYIDQGAKINEDQISAGNGQSVLVAAGTDLRHLGIGAAVSIGGQVGLGPAAEVTVVDNNTRAFIGKSARVNAAEDVEVIAESTQDIISIAGAGALGVGAVGLAGAVPVISIDNETSAYVEGTAQGEQSTRVDADGNIAISASDRTETDIVAGSVAGGLVGVGGAVGVTIIEKDTTAFAGSNAEIDAKGNSSGSVSACSGMDNQGGLLTKDVKGLSIRAESSEDFSTITGAGAGGFAGVAGAVAVSTIDSSTSAYIGSGAKVNQNNAGANAEQDVNVSAVNTLSGFAVSGSIAGGAVGLSGGLGFHTVQNDVSAHLGDQARVKAARDVELTALSNKEAETYAVSAAGGAVGLAGGVTVLTIGEMPDDASVQDLAAQGGNEDYTNPSEYANEQAGYDFMGAALSDTYGMDSIKSETSQATSAVTVAPTAAPAGTSAFIGKSATVEAGRDILITAHERIDADMISGSAATGLASLGGGVGIAKVRSQVRAYIDDDIPGHTSSINATGDIDISASLDEKTLNQAFAGGLSAFVGVSGAVTYTDNDYLVDAHIGRNVAVNQADTVSVSARSSTDDKSESLEGTISGGLPIGVSYAEVDSDGSTSAYVDDGVRIGTSDEATVNSLEISASASGKADADSKHLAGGIIAGGYNEADSSVNPTVIAAAGSDARITLEGNLDITSRADVSSTAYTWGDNFGAVAVGAGVVEASARPVVKAYIEGGDDSAVSAGENISIRAFGNHDLDGVEQARLIKAENDAVGGSLFFSHVSPSATATSDWTVEAYIGADADVEAEGDVEILAKSHSGEVVSDVNGKSYSLAGLGNNISSTTVTNTVSAHVDEDVFLSAKSIDVNAQGKSNAYATTYGGAGGIIAGASASAGTNVTNTVSAYLAGNDDGAAQISASTDIAVSALSDVVFNAHGASTGYGFVGSNGVRTSNTVTSTARAYIGQDADLLAGEDILVAAANRVTKPFIGANLSAGAGGFWGGPAGDSVTTITNIAEAYAVGNSTIDSGNRIEAQGDITLSAANDVSAYDRATLSSGGAIAVADVHSTITSTNTAQTSIGENAEILAANDVNLHSQTKANVEAVTYTEGFGLGASADGKAIANVTADNDTVVGAHAKIRAGNDINVFAGKDPDGMQNNLRVRAEARSFSAGGIPFSSVGAYACLNDYNGVLVDTGADLKAGGDINAGAFKGMAFTEGYARAKLRTYALFGIPITWYNNGSRTSAFQSSDSVIVNGALESGTNRHRTLFIGADGHAFGNISAMLTEDVDGAAELQVRIDALNDQINSEETDENVKIILAQERSRLEARLQEIMDRRSDPDDPDPAYGFFDRFSLEDTIVGSGDINLTGTLKGNGTLKSPGNDFMILIQNESLAHLELGDLEIPEELSGTITLNNRTITSHGTVHVDPGQNLGSRIMVENLYDPDAPGADEGVWSDMVLRGDITNMGGTIDIVNASGSIESIGDIIGDEVSIFAAREFAQSYTPGVWHSPDPLISGGSISISGQILNIRGTIQSGIPVRTITIPEFDPAALIAGSDGRKAIPTSGDSNIKAYWDDENQCIQLYSVKITGGNITLAGEIVSTGGGRLKVIDGYGEIEVTNHSSQDLVINRLDTGNRINGMIKITDTGKLDDQGNPLVTEITGVNGDLNVTRYRVRWDEENSRVVVVENSMASNPVDGRTTHYEPREGARFADLGADQAISNSRDLNPCEQLVLDFFGQQGDHAIDIEFMGSDRSRIDVTGTGAADILLNDRIVNRNGDVSILNSRGSIFSLNESARISGTNITLSAFEGEVGNAAQAIHIDTKGGVLRAEAEGLINIREMEGDIVIDSLSTRGNALITADGSIYDLPCGSASIVAQDITLVSENGGIGSADNDLSLDSQDGILTARAKESIYLTETEGTMRVNRVASAEGDVTLISHGSIEDYNFPEVDEDTLEQLADARSDLNLGSDEKVQEAIQAHRQQKKTEYQAQHRVSDNGTPFEPNDDLYDSTYDPDWEYTLTDAEEKAFAESVWQDEDLVNAKNILTLPGDITSDEEANVSGRNITLISNANIGAYGGTAVIDKADIASGNVTPEQRALLVRAEKGEAFYDEQDNVVVSLDRDFNVEASGRIDIRSNGYVYLDAVHTAEDHPLKLKADAGGRVDIAMSGGDLVIESLSTRGDALITAGGSMYDLQGKGASITAQDITLVSENGGIGSADNDLTTDSQGGVLTARAKEGIYLTETNGTMRVNRVASAEGDVTLIAHGSIENSNANSMAGEEANVSGRNITLISNLNIGAPDGNAITGETGTAAQDFRVETSGRIDIRADGCVNLSALHTTQDRPLKLSVSGRTGHMADSVDISAASEHSILFDTLFAREAEIDAAGNLGISRALIAQKARFTDQRYSGIVDNAPRALEDADVQLYAKGLEFHLFFPVQGETFQTNAHVVHHQDDVIINGFSSESSVTRLLPKLLVCAEPRGEDSVRTDEALMSRRSAPVQRTVDYDSGLLGIDDEDIIVDEEDGAIEWE